MAVALDVSNAGAITASGTSASWSHTITTASDTHLFILLGFSNLNPTSIGVTVDGNAATLEATVDISTAGNKYKSQIYRIAIPATGSKAVSVTWTGNSRCSWASISFTGVSAGTPTADIEQTGTSVASGNQTVAKTTASGDAALILYAVTADGGVPATVDTGDTQIRGVSTGTVMAHYSSYQLASGASTTVGLSALNISRVQARVSLTVKQTSGGTTNQDLTVTNTPTASVLLALAFARVLSVAAGSTPTLLRVLSMLRALTVARASTPTLARVALLLRVLSVTESNTATLLRGYVRQLSVTRASAATLALASTRLRQLAVTTVTVATMSRVLSLLRTLSFASVSSASVVRLVSFGRLLTATVSSVATLLLLRPLVLAVAAGSFASVARVASLFRTLASTIAPQVTYLRFIGKTLAISVSNVAAMTKFRALLLGATAGVVVTFGQLRGILLGVVRSPVASVARALSLSRTLVALVDGRARFQFLIGKVLVVSAPTFARVSRGFFKNILVFRASAASLVNDIFRKAPFPHFGTRRFLGQRRVDPLTGRRNSRTWDR